MLTVVFKKHGAVAGFPAKSKNAAAKATYEGMGLFWHENQLDKHFTHAGAREYNYAPRQTAEPGARTFARSYTGQKLKKFGHTLPLVKTGQSRRLCRIRDVRPSSKGARIVLHARTFNFKNALSFINMRQEVTSVSKTDEEQLGEAGERLIQKEADAVRETSTKVLK